MLPWQQLRAVDISERGREIVIMVSPDEIYGVTGRRNCGKTLEITIKVSPGDGSESPGETRNGYKILFPDWNSRSRKALIKEKDRFGFKWY
jgi:hypothetical protein